MQPAPKRMRRAEARSGRGHVRGVRRNHHGAKDILIGMHKRTKLMQKETENQKVQQLVNKWTFSSHYFKKTSVSKSFAKAFSFSAASRRRPDRQLFIHEAACPDPESSENEGWGASAGGGAGRAGAGRGERALGGAGRLPPTHRPARGGRCGPRPWNGARPAGAEAANSSKDEAANSSKDKCNFTCCVKFGSENPQPRTKAHQSP